jgi:hypothetical protein
MSTFSLKLARGTKRPESPGAPRPAQPTPIGFSDDTKRSQLQTAIVGVALLVVLAVVPIAQALGEH